MHESDRNSLKRWIDSNDRMPIDELLSSCATAQRLFQQELAARLQEPVMEKIYHMPQTSLQDFREVCNWVNQIVGTFSLAIKCPKTGHKAVLRPHSMETGPRFVFSYYDPNKQSYIATMHTRVLPHLELTTRDEMQQSPPKRSR